MIEKDDDCRDDLWSMVYDNDDGEDNNEDGDDD